jgi:predicted transglutaminase-like cysteine proteinase
MVVDTHKLQRVFRALVVAACLMPVVFYAYGIDFNADKLRDTITKRWGPSAGQKFHDWQKLVEEARKANTPEQKLQNVNDFWNQHIRFMDDTEAWNQSDYWATPMESLGNEKGDCEDFAIAKYFTLLAANIDVAQLRLIYVKAKIGGSASSIVQAHMVLAYYSTPDAEPVILDNLIGDIRPASHRQDLTPVFSFNSQGIWAGISAAGNASSTGTSRLTRWQDLLTRAKAEGFE